MSLFVWQSNKAILFCFTQISVSQIQLGTSIQRGWGFGFRSLVEELRSCKPCGQRKEKIILNKGHSISTYVNFPHVNLGLAGREEGKEAPTCCSTQWVCPPDYTDSFLERWWQVVLSVSLRFHKLCFLFSHLDVSNSWRPHGSQHARLSCPSLSPGDCSNSCPLNHWCHPTISSSVSSFFSCP